MTIIHLKNYSEERLVILPQSASPSNQPFHLNFVHAAEKLHSVKYANNSYSNHRIFILPYNIFLFKFYKRIRHDKKNIP